MMNPIKLKISHDVQYEGHTCGLCALSSVYAYYGMDADDYELRTYLGTDNILPYNFPARERIEAWMGGKENFFAGTMPPDMLAVLYWDGFDTATHTGYARYRERLTAHLENGDPALVILYGCWHWAIVSGIDDAGVWITDSLCWSTHGNKHRYRLSHAEFAAKEHGVILVSRDEEYDDGQIRDMTYLDFTREYARGLAFAAAMLKRNIPRWMGLPRTLPPTTVKKKAAPPPILDSLHKFLDDRGDKTGVRAWKERLPHPQRPGCVTLRIPGYKQLQSYTCGFVAAANVLHLFQPEAELSPLFDRLDSDDRTGTVSLQLKGALRGYGIGVRHRSTLDFSGICKAIDAGCPIIVGIQTAQGGHWTIIYGYDKTRETLFISGNGWLPELNRKETPYTRFARKMDPPGNGLVCSSGRARSPRGKGTSSEVRIVRAT